ncbi:MAG: helix-turn-helix domain-containing protein [Patescibacteria group bacterium]
MSISKTFGGDIKQHLINVLGEKVALIDSEGNFITDTNHKSEFSALKDLNNIKNYRITKGIDGIKELIVPLKYQNQNEAFLLFKGKIENDKSFVPLAKSFSELLIQQYYEENQPVLDSTDQFITKLIFNSSTHDMPMYESESKVLGYNLDVKRVAIVIYLKNFWERCLASMDQPSFERDTIIKSWKRNIETNLKSFFSKSNDMITAYIGNDKFVVFKSVTTEEEEKLKNLLKNSHKAIFEPLKSLKISEIAVGFGNPYSSIRGIIDSFKEANSALELGLRLKGENRSYYFNDLGILRILTDGEKEKKIHFACQMLNNLTNKELAKTLEVFFEQNLNLTDTALKMGIHRNTVIYRLNQIAIILGLDPRIFDQAVTIKIGLIIKKLFC